MTITIIDIKFYIMHYLLWLSSLKQKLITARCVCNIERTPHFITTRIQLQLRPIN